jgi:PAS domain S-box-containing protein
MLRIHREIARDAARAAGVPLAQLLAVATGEAPAAVTLAVEGAALSSRPLRGRISALLAAAPGHLAAAPLLSAPRAFRLTAPCEPALAGALWPDHRQPPAATSVFFRLQAGPGEAVLLRLVAAGRLDAGELRALDAVARLAAGRLAGESYRREAAGRRAAYRVYQEAAAEPILVLDAETGRLLEANQRLSQLTGWGRQELRRLTLWRLLDHPSLDAGALLEALAGTATASVDDARLRRRRGEPVPVALTSARIELDGRPVLHLIARDVSRERRALAEQREARELLAALHLAGAHLSVETDEEAVYGVLARELARLGFHCGVLAPAPDGPPAFAWRFLSFPPPLRRALDHALGTPLAAVRVDPMEAPLLRRCLAERRTVHTDRPRRAAAGLLGAATPLQVRRLARLVAIRRVILAPLLREGRAEAALVVAAPRVRRSDPEAIDAFALQASIALDKARLVGALRDERARLESEVERRTAELRQAVAALEAADRRKDNFLANVSHELRTPLVTVLGYADLLLGEKLGPLAARQRTALQVVASSGRRLRAFIEELLELSRHELARPAEPFAPLPLADVITQAVVALAPRFAERRVRVRARVARGTPPALGQRERVLQVLVNLLGNAERYAPEGSAIHLAAARVGDRVAVSVTDRGPGIPEEHQALIFERLYQVRDDRAPRREGGALGIGLAIAKGIVEAHGGEIGVRSRVGWGTRFRVTLPAAGAAPGARERDAS